MVSDVKQELKVLYNLKKRGWDRVGADVNQ